MGFSRFFLVAAVCLLPGTALGVNDFVNFETPQVHPVDISPGGATLAACNTPDNRIQLYDLSSGTPQPMGALPVGYDPVSVRFRTATELWVVNQISDSVSVIDLTVGAVIDTLQTRDEPADVVFAGSPVKAFVSCSQANTLQVFDPANRQAPPADIAINGEDPRALAVSPDGGTVYAAIFESGNRSTVLGGGAGDTGTITFPPNVVDDPNTPHGTQNPPFNDDGVFTPPKASENGTAPEVGLIVKQDEEDVWRDDTGADWTAFVSGSNAHQSGRPEGWTLLDHDVAVIDAGTLAVSYIDHMMNLCMALAVNPADGTISVVGTDALNEIRFEPNVNSIFVRNNVAFAAPTSTTADSIVDLNGGHLDYSVKRIAQSERNKSLGEPRGIVWNAAGTRGYITGRGSNNLIIIDAAGNRVGAAGTIELPEGPTGVALDEARDQLYVLSRFDGSLSVVDTSTETVVQTLPFFDPTPDVIKIGRRHLYDTHKTSGLGQVSCASCHVDARMDRLAWDLGDPRGEVTSLEDRNLGGGFPVLSSDGIEPFDPFHPMKGPMTTQTLQGIIGHEPFHWRGDRLGLEEFNVAFVGLQGDDEMLTDSEMDEYKDYLATIHFPPNPFRNLDNSLPTALEMDGHFVPPGFDLPAGDPLPNGNAQRGLDLFRDQNRKLDQGIAACVTCHALPSGNGTDMRWNGSELEPIPVGPNGEHHLMLVSIDGSTQTSIKVPQLRNLYDKVGMNMIHTESRAGFGYIHDGSADSIERFVSEGAFNVANAQEIADLTALMLAFSGSDFGVTDPASGFLEAPGVNSKDAHAAMGKQVTVDSATKNISLLNDLLAAVEQARRIDFVAHGLIAGNIRGALYQGNDTFQSDQADTTFSLTDLLNLADTGTPITFTVVPRGAGRRIALDRDRDGCLDYDEFLAGTDPADPLSPGDGTCVPLVEGEFEGEGEFIEGEIEPIDCPPVPFPDVDDAMTRLNNNGIFQQLGSNFTLNPTGADVNGGFDINDLAVFPNGLIDSYEFALMTRALADPNLDLGPGNLTHAAVQEAWENNKAAMDEDLGVTAPILLDGIQFLLPAFMTLGDNDSADFVDALLFAAIVFGPDFGVTDVSAPNREDYLLLGNLLGLNGNADGDAFPNQQEYSFFVPRADTAHTVTASVDGAGTVSPAGAVNLAAGGSQIFEFTPDPGYRLVDVLVDGRPAGPQSKFLFIKDRVDYVAAALDASVTPDTPGALATGHTVLGVFERCETGEGEGLPAEGELAEGEGLPVEGEPLEGELTEGELTEGEVTEGEGAPAGGGEPEGEGPAEGEPAAEGEPGFEGEGLPRGVDFCATMNSIVAAANDPALAPLVDLLGDEAALIAELACDTADLNGGLPQGNVTLPEGNGMLDGAFELGVVAEIINNPGPHTGLVTGTLRGQVAPGVDATKVGPAYQHNFNAMFGPIEPLLPILPGLVEGLADIQLTPEQEDLLLNLLPDLVTVLAGYATLGDDESVDAVLLVLGFVSDFVSELPEARGDFRRVGGILSAEADADGDGFTNREEYNEFAGVTKSAADYVTAALSPRISPAGILEGEPVVEGEIGGEGEGGLAEGEASAEPEGEAEPVKEGEIIILPEGEAESIEEGEIISLPEGEEGEIVVDPEGEAEPADEGETGGVLEGEAESAEEGEGAPVPGGEAGGEGLLEGEGGDEGERPDEGEVEGLPDAPEMHTADRNRDAAINLAELLRVIQLYTAGRYHCDQDNLEDGFGTGPGPEDCPPHASDFGPQDWKIGLSELLRLIQFFSLGGYFDCPEPTEDGFCPGSR